MDIWFLIIAAVVIAGALIRAADASSRRARMRGTSTSHQAARSEMEGWIAVDPVCGAVGPVEQTPATVEHEGHRFYFCSQQCKDLFSEHPQQYVSAPGEPARAQDRSPALEHWSTAQPAGEDVGGLDWRLVGLALTCFFALTYVLCVVFGLLFPQWAMYEVWSPLLPGFSWLSWGSFLLGLAGTAAYGFYIALVFCPLYNLLSQLVLGRGRQERVASKEISE